MSDITKRISWKKGWHDLPEAQYRIKTPGVTSIINDMIADPEMENWILRDGKEKVDKILKLAGYRGTAMHIFIENFINSLATDKDPSKALKYTQVKSVKMLKEEKIPDNKIEEGRELFYKFYYSDFPSEFINLIKTEIPIYSPTYFYRGKIDIFYTAKAFGVSVTDFKTSSDFIKKDSLKEVKYKFQLGAYANAVDELYKHKNIVVKNSSILCVNTKTEMLQEITCSGKELEHYKNEFKTLAKQWHIKNNQKFLFN